MYRTLVTAVRSRLPISLSRSYLPPASATSQVSLRMVSTKTLAVCDVDDLKDGEMSAALIADISSPALSFTSRSAHSPDLQEGSRFWEWEGLVVQDR